MSKANHKNRSRWTVDLLPEPETVGGLTLIGTITRQGSLVDPLLRDADGSYFAQTPRGLEQLRTDKVDAAIRTFIGSI